MSYAIKVEHKVKMRRQRKCEYIYNFSTIKMLCPNTIKKQSKLPKVLTLDFYFGGIQFESQTR